MSKNNPECNRSALKTTLTVLGFGIGVGLILGFTTKRVLDEIFVDQDWSDEEWTEFLEDDFAESDTSDTI